MKHVKLFEEFVYSLVNESLLLDVMKKYPKIDQTTLKNIIKADTISSNLNQSRVGKYGNWLLKLYNNKSLKIDDLTKASDYINEFDRIQNNGKSNYIDVNEFNSLQDLFNFIKPFHTKYNTNTVSTSDIIKNKEVDLVFEDSDWVVIIPKSEIAALSFTDNKEWKKAYKINNEFFKDGKIYININKLTNRKYLFNFEDFEFVCDNGKTIQLSKFRLTNGLIKYYRTVIPLFDACMKYDQLTKFQDGSAMVGLDYHDWGYVDNNGKLLIPLSYDINGRKKLFDEIAKFGRKNNIEIKKPAYIW